MNFNQRAWRLKQRTHQYFTSDTFFKKLSYFKGSVFAILIGFIASGILILALKQNPFVYFYDMFRLISYPEFTNKTVIWMVVFLISGLAIAVGFKTKLFNIGGSGQSLIGFMISLVISQNYLNSHGSYMDKSAWVLFLLIFMISGAFLAMVSGVLKSFFNVHEVVSSIMLNWIVWYVLKNLVTQDPELYGSFNSAQTTALLPIDYLYINGKESWLIPVIIGILVLAVTVFVMNFTTLGFKQRAIGYSSTAANYAGYNSKWGITTSMMISGMMMGIAGFILYFCIRPSVSLAHDTLPTLGFDALAVALVPFNNLIGIVPISILWGIIKENSFGASVLNGNISNEVSSIMFGIIIYFAAISSLMIRFMPIKEIKKFICIKTNLLLKKDVYIYKRNIKISKANISLMHNIKQLNEIEKEFGDNKQLNELIKSINKISNLEIKEDNVSDLIQFKKDFENKKIQYLDSIAIVNSKNNKALIKIIKSSIQFKSYSLFRDKILKILKLYNVYTSTKEQNKLQLLNLPNNFESDQLKEKVSELNDQIELSYNRFKEEYKSFIDLNKFEISKNKNLMNNKIDTKLQEKPFCLSKKFKNIFISKKNHYLNEDVIKYDNIKLEYLNEKNKIIFEWKNNTIAWKKELKLAKENKKIFLKKDSQILQTKINSINGLNIYKDSIYDAKFNYLQNLQNYKREINLIRENYLMSKKNSQDLSIKKDIKKKYINERLDLIKWKKDFKNKYKKILKNSKERYIKSKESVDQEQINLVKNNYLENINQIINTFNNELIKVNNLKENNLNYKKEKNNVYKFKKDIKDLKIKFITKIEKLINDNKNKIQILNTLFSKSYPIFIEQYNEIKNNYIEELKQIDNDYDKYIKLFLMSNVYDKFDSLTTKLSEKIISEGGAY